MSSLAILCSILSVVPSPTKALEAREAAVRALLPPSPRPLTPSLRHEAEKVLTHIVDLDGMALASLGRHRATVKGEERTAYLAAFARRFTRSTGEEIDSFRSNAIRYVGEEPASGGDVRVSTEATVDQEPTRIDYLMRREGGGQWRIADIVIDGVSTVENFQRSFDRIIAQEGMKGLIRRLQRGMD